jgi:hypothetical protein
VDAEQLSRLAPARRSRHDEPPAVDARLQGEPAQSACEVLEADPHEAFRQAGRREVCERQGRVAVCSEERRDVGLGETALGASEQEHAGLPRRRAGRIEHLAVEPGDVRPERPRVLAGRDEPSGDNRCGERAVTLSQRQAHDLASRWRLVEVVVGWASLWRVHRPEEPQRGAVA